MNFKPLINKLAPHLIALVAMFAFASIYFYPAWEGKSLQGEDVIGGYGKAREKNDFRYYEDKTTLWNGSIFSGMPDFIGAPYKGATLLKNIFYFPQRSGVPREVASLLWYMIGFYVLLITMRMSPLLSAGGAMAFSITSYYVIIILAGHYMKVYTLALIPPALAGILLCFKGKYLWGFLLTAFFLAMQISMAHIQMIYYFLLFLIGLGAVEFYFHIKEKEVMRFLKTAGVLLAAGILAIGPNYSRLLNYYKYNDHSIRGSSEITIGKEDVATKDGLDKDYINSWSSGVDESMMIVVPNVKGGMTGQVSQDRELINKVSRQYKSIIGNFNKYWGNQPFSGGPNYLGVVFVLLFLIGVFSIRNRLKIIIIIPTVLFFLLSMGGNLSALTDLFIYHVPFYNKFRAPVSILAIAAILISLFALYTIHKIVKEDEILKKSSTIRIFKKPKPIYLLVSFGFIVFLLFNAAFPESLNTYISEGENSYFNSLRSQQNVAGQLDGIIGALVDLRIKVFRADIWRAIILSGFVILGIYLYSLNKIKQNVFVGLLILLSIIDFWAVGRRYVSLDHFTKRSLVDEAYQLTAEDQQIYQYQLNETPDLKNKIDELREKFVPATEEENQRLLTYGINKYSHYRVFNTRQSPFQENVTSSAHRSVGGYHAVKLRRYQDLIEHHISKMNQGVLNMLNTKYLITPQGVQVNRDAFGEAWVVDSVKWVADPNEEILALNNTNLQASAVIRSESKEEFPEFNPDQASNAQINLVDYEPDKMVYSINIPETKLIVFSEVYYPDWELYVDGERTEIYRANYVLRAAVIPKGEHTAEFVFHPKHFYQSNLISRYAIYILIIMLLGALTYAIIKPLIINRSKDAGGK